MCFNIAAATGGNRSSMGQDVDHQRLTEISAINGAVVSEASNVGIPVPVNQTLTALVETPPGPIIRDAFCHPQQKKLDSRVGREYPSPPRQTGHADFPASGFPLDFSERHTLAMKLPNDYKYISPNFCKCR